MPEATPAVTNAERRAVLLARFEERLREVRPEETPGRRVPFADFNEPEAKATVLGDETTRRIMESPFDLAVSERPERCAECGRKLQYSRKAKTTDIIRGPVRAERDYRERPGPPGACCRGCRRGSSPRCGGLPSSEGSTERPVSQGARRGRLELGVPPQHRYSPDSRHLHLVQVGYPTHN